MPRCQRKGIRPGAGPWEFRRHRDATQPLAGNRLHTDQVVTHAVWQVLQGNHQRWTVDLSSKHGRATADDELVSGKALSVTYDYRDIFFRLAQDRKVNFTAEDQTRLSVGLRF